MQGLVVEEGREAQTRDAVRASHQRYRVRDGEALDKVGDTRALWLSGIAVEVGSPIKIRACYYCVCIKAEGIRRSRKGRAIQSRR